MDEDRRRLERAAAAQDVAEEYDAYQDVLRRTRRLLGTEYTNAQWNEELAALGIPSRMAIAGMRRRGREAERGVAPLNPVSVMAAPPRRRRREHHCSGCGSPAPGVRWCDECRCTGVNAKGRRCGNRSGLCSQHDADP